MTAPSPISITLNGVDITGQVLFRETSFQSQANPVQGTFRVAVRDDAHTFAPVAGQKLKCFIDGVPLFGGYVMRIHRGFFFPAEDTSTPGSVVRKWTIEGPDFNVLFDKRVLYHPTNHKAALKVPSGKRTISKAFRYLMENYLDVPSNLDWETHLDTIATGYGTEEEGSLFVGQSKTWREQMEDFMDHGAVMYYIDAEFKHHLHEYETVTMPWYFTDHAPNGTSSIGFREGTYREDYGQLVTDALVWGGSTIRQSDGGPGGDIVFARYPDPPANTATWYNQVQSASREQEAIDRQNTLGRWQRGEERAGQDNYLTKASVKNRAFAIINGPPGAVPTHGIESGFSRPMETMSCTWFAHDVPGNYHVRPGYLMTFILYTQGAGSGAKVTTLPCRSIRISFPTLPADAPGSTWVRFEGDFGISYSDRRYLWKAIRGQRQSANNIIFTADNSTSSVASGSYATVWAEESPNGTRKKFTFPFTFYDDRFDLFLNGLFQRKGIDYTYDATTKQVTFVSAPGTGDQMWATGYVSQ